MKVDPVTTHQTKIYCDGACEPNPGKMGIGVFCESPEIRIAEAAGDGTNNEAECLAAIAALEEAKRRGLYNFLLLSDSRLVCNWSRGTYQCISTTARLYVPQIKVLLNELEANLSWCPGESNPADALSRFHVGCRDDLRRTDPLRYVIETPMEKLHFRDFARIKVGGRDEFSRLRLPRLNQLVSEHAEVHAEFEDDKSVASCLRWILRGLPLEKAIRKVRTDLEIAENAKSAY